MSADTVYSRECPDASHNARLLTPGAFAVITTSFGLEVKDCNTAGLLIYAAKAVRSLEENGTSNDQMDVPGRALRLYIDATRQRQQRRGRQGGHPSAGWVVCLRAGGQRRSRTKQDSDGRQERGGCAITDWSFTGHCLSFTAFN